MNTHHTEVVRIRKNRGSTTKNCDIYIGPAIYNNYWNLKQSKWNNPFHFLNKENPEKAKEMFKRHIYSSRHLRNENLLELKDKTLGCFCEKHENCHGMILIELLNEYLEKKKVEKSGDSNYFISTRCFYFKGSKVPLSNLYKCKIVDNEETFSSSYQLFAWRKALFFNEKYIAKSILHDGSFQNVNKMLKMIDHTRSEKQFNSIQEMFAVLRRKFHQVPEFKELLMEFDNFMFVECTTDKFWGCGTDFPDMLKLKEKLCTIPFRGNNVLGWLLLVLRRFDKDWKILFGRGGEMATVGEEEEETISAGKKRTNEVMEDVMNVLFGEFLQNNEDGDKNIIKKIWGNSFGVNDRANSDLTEEERKIRHLLLPLMDGFSMVKDAIL